MCNFVEFECPVSLCPGAHEGSVGTSKHNGDGKARSLPIVCLGPCRPLVVLCSTNILGGGAFGCQWAQCDKGPGVESWCPGSSQGILSLPYAGPTRPVPGWSHVGACGGPILGHHARPVTDSPRVLQSLLEPSIVQQALCLDLNPTHPRVYRVVFSQLRHGGTNPRPGPRCGRGADCMLLPPAANTTASLGLRGSIGWLTDRVRRTLRARSSSRRCRPSS